MVRQSKTLPDGTVVVRDSEGGINKIRCPRCHSVAPPHRKQDGTIVNKCQACGTEYKTTTMK